ncbi:hypothetical protein GQ55_3G124900 [Panicum hallii var. hallii]|uniref:Uncharacterized protein n=2 Tax=Panicum hallii TaxID=206008 RepID=A0A2T7E8Q3_9POAL|nr:hypothetical protein PAHAL_3G133300 [Panicum hallii]PUZ64208.1 hypothetical protein GQ55_3G124900 [Panicum hallii var. hallii]
MKLVPAASVGASPSSSAAASPSADMLKTRAESSHEDCLPEMQRNCLLAGDGTC